MPTDHDAIAHVDRLRQALESPRRPLALFLSAGCPMAVEDEYGSKPLMPDVTGMTKELTKRLEGSDDAEAFAKPRKVLVEDGQADADLEYMLSLVGALRDVAGTGGARGLSLDELQRLDDAISDEVANLARPSLPALGTPYHDAVRWVGGTMRDDPVEVFTTNYDLLSEQALEEVGVPYFDGFVGAREPFFDVRAIEDDILPSDAGRSVVISKIVRAPSGPRPQRSIAAGISPTSVHPAASRASFTRRCGPPGR